MIRVSLFLVLMILATVAFSCEPKPKAVKWLVIYKCTLVAAIEFEETEKTLIVKVPISMCANGINHASIKDGRPD